MKPTPLLIGSLIMLASPAGTDLSVERYVAGNGGGSSNGPLVSMLSSAGQAAVGLLYGPVIQAEVGFWSALGGSVSLVPESPADAPGQLEMSAPIPNPVRGTASIRFRLPLPTKVEIRLYDVSGREAVSLTDDVYPAGWHELPLKTRGLSSGVYLCRMTAGDQEIYQRLILLK